MNDFFKELDKAHWLIRVFVFGGYIFFGKLVIKLIVETKKLLKNVKSR